MKKFAILDFRFAIGSGGVAFMDAKIGLSTFLPGRQAAGDADDDGAGLGLNRDFHVVTELS